MQKSQEIGIQIEGILRTVELSFKPRVSMRAEHHLVALVIDERILLRCIVPFDGIFGLKKLQIAQPQARLRLYQVQEPQQQLLDARINPVVRAVDSYTEREREDERARERARKRD